MGVAVRELSNELGLQNVMNGNTSKTLIKRTIAKKIKEEAWKTMEDSKKVRDRLTFNPDDNSYIKCHRQGCGSDTGLEQFPK